MSAAVWALLVVWGVAGAAGLALYGLDWLAGWVHRHRARRRSLWF